MRLVRRFHRAVGLRRRRRRLLALALGLVARPCLLAILLVPGLAVLLYLPFLGLVLVLVAPRHLHRIRAIRPVRRRRSHSPRLDVITSTMERMAGEFTSGLARFEGFSLDCI